MKLFSDKLVTGVDKPKKFNSQIHGWNFKWFYQEIQLHVAIQKTLLNFETMRKDVPLFALITSNYSGTGARTRPGEKDVQMKISMIEKNLSSTQVMKTNLLVLFTIP